MKLFPNASRLGFGCASLGSRIGGREGQRALSAAFDRGINWFDLAPSYGDGQAEIIFAEFARTRRDSIHICTKCGIAPARIGGLAAAVRPVARAAVKALPGLRRLAAGHRAAPIKQVLSGDMIRASLDASLRRLGTDHVDVLALHDPAVDELGRDDVARALQDVVASGKARAAGIAGSVEAIRAGLAAGLALGHIQLASGLGLGELRREFAAPMDSLFTVTHTVFGRDGVQDRAAALDLALAENPQGTVLVSMFSPEHLEFNLARLLQGVASSAKLSDI
jgi:aryl-alcohol dehydrogenase-like predicted oxidoreductase